MIIAKPKLTIKCSSNKTYLKLPQKSSHQTRQYGDSDLSSIFDPTIIFKPNKWIEPRNLLNPWNPLSPFNDSVEFSDKTDQPIKKNHVSTHQINNLSNKTDLPTKINNSSSPVDQFNRLGKLENTLIWVGGGPGSGKTTLLNNIANAMQHTYGQDINEMLIIGNTLVNSLRTSSKSMDKILDNRSPIIIDNHCTDSKNINSVVEFAKKNSYRIVLIYPWVTYETFTERLIKRKEEIGRDFDLNSFWNKHIIFHQHLHSYITESNQFDVCIVFNNNYDYYKPIICSKIMEKCYIVNKYFLGTI